MRTNKAVRQTRKARLTKRRVELFMMDILSQDNRTDKQEDDAENDHQADDTRVRPALALLHVLNFRVRPGLPGLVPYSSHVSIITL